MNYNINNRNKIPPDDGFVDYKPKQDLLCLSDEDLVVGNQHYFTYKEEMK